MVKRIKTNAAPAAIGPYAQAVICDNMLYASGQIPINPQSGEIESDDIVDQTRRVMKNIGAILTAAELCYADVIKTTVFLTDLDDFAKVNEIYSEFFPEPYPARSCVQVAKLPRGAKIEVEIIARAKYAH